MKQKPSKQPPVNWEQRAKSNDDRRRRIVQAFLALREVKSVAVDLEPAIMRVRRRLLALAPALAPKIEPRRPQVVETIISMEVARILRELDESLETLVDEPRSPINARYVEAERQLKPGDLDLR